MQLDCWNIQGGSFHFGIHGLGQEQTTVSMASDSLFAALVARLARTHGSQAAAEFCQPFVEGSPPFVLSSTFPFAAGVRFLPVPLTGRGDEPVGASAKDLKRVQYISEGVFRAMLAGASLAQAYDAAHVLQAGQALLSEEDFLRLPEELRTKEARIWAIEQRPRVTLARAGSASNLFHIGQVHFSDGCGLWFGVRWLEADQARQKQLKDMLYELAQTGFGAERGVGLGIASLSGPVAMQLPDADGAWVTLSRYLPQEDETEALARDNSAYSIKKVSGWLDSPANMGQRRIPVNLIEEGSVIGGRPLRAAPGQMVDVRPRYPGNEDPLGHPVYRCGLALAVGLEGGGG